jgi:hypothetical protein
MDNWRVMRLPISEPMMVDILQGKLVFTDFVLPPDVKVVRVSHDFALNGFQILLESAAFEPVPLGQHIPMLPPARLQLERIKYEDTNA